MSLIYALFGLLDYAVYSIAAVLVTVIMKIASAEIFEANQIAEIVSKVYVIVGVLMLFKLVISAIQFMLNPDTFDDKEKGLGGILKKTVISLALIALVPAIFDFAIALQEPIIEALPKIILSNGDNSSGNNDINKDNVGNKVAYEVLSSFVSIKTKDKNGNNVNYEDCIGDNNCNSNTNNDNEFETFRKHIADGCSFFDDGTKCHYNYLIIISTLCGGFLVYVLLSLVLDVAIRTIKFQIIEILAPIPISSYIYSKDKLNKFVKTATQVYADLFIRMAIIYFIIFAIQSIFESNLFKENYADNWFLSLAIRVALIFGLLMFAKNAPKFLSELLGLPDIGAGDMKDMFTPAWKKAGGAAGAIINPARTAISNTRAAWKNNADMVDSRGGKLRRAMQRTRRVVNAGRHGMGGLARGALDSVEGVMNGDDWSKISQRHDAAKKRSDMRSAAGFMKRTSKADAREKNDAIEKKREELGQWLADHSEIDDMRKQASSGANTNYMNHMNQLKSDMSKLENELYTGRDAHGHKLTASQINARRTKLNELKSNYDRLSTADGKKEWIANETDSIVANRITSMELAKRRNTFNNNARYISSLKSEIASGRDAHGRVLSAEEIASRKSRVVELETANAELDKAINTQEGRTKIAQESNAKLGEFRKVEQEFDKLVEEKYDANDDLIRVKPDITTGSIVRGKVDKFFGGEGFTGKGYVDTADLLKNNRSSLYTGEAMTKMRQNADILVDSDGSPHKFKIKFTTKDVNYSYAEMADIKRRVDNGSLTDPKELADLGFADIAMVQSAFEDMEKQAADAYVTANMAAADPSVHSDIKLKGNAPANTTIVEGIKRMKAQIASSNIPKEVRDKLLKDLSENPGKFFKGASDVQEKMRTQGSRINAFNSGKKEGQ